MAKSEPESITVTYTANGMRNGQQFAARMRSSFAIGLQQYCAKSNMTLADFWENWIHEDKKQAFDTIKNFVPKELKYDDPGGGAAAALGLSAVGVFLGELAAIRSGRTIEVSCEDGSVLPAEVPAEQEGHGTSMAVREVSGGSE